MKIRVDVRNLARAGAAVGLAGAVALTMTATPAAAKDGDRMRVKSNSDRGCLQVGLQGGANPDSGHKWRNVVTTTKCTNYNNIWYIKGKSIYTMAGNKKQCLDIDRGKKTMGAGLNVIVYEDCHGGGNQQWTQLPNGQIRSAIQNDGKQLCLDPQGATIRTDGRVGKVHNVHVYVCGDQPWQRWTVS